MLKVRCNYFPTFLVTSFRRRYKNIDEWIDFFEKENVYKRHLSGNKIPFHTLKTIPFDYNLKLENAWIKANNNPESCHFPINVFYYYGYYVIWDGNHRYAISLKHNLFTIPVIVRYPNYEHFLVQKKIPLNFRNLIEKQDKEMNDKFGTFKNEIKIFL